MSTTQFVWDELSDNVLDELDENGDLSARYTNQPGKYGGLISEFRNSESNFFHFDGQGSTRQVTQSNKVVDRSYSYSAFGETIASTGSGADNFKFKGAVGYYADNETGNYYVRKRSLVPGKGRWLSRDPLNRAVGISRPYTYSGNSPINFIDPSGELEQVPIDLPPIVRYPDELGPGIIVITISTRDYPGLCGSYVFPTNWVPGENEKDGLIIQRVCVKGSVEMCDKDDKCKTNWDTLKDMGIKPKACRNKTNCPNSNLLNGADFCYYEVWRVWEGKVYQNQITPRKPRDPDEGPTDVFAWLGCKAPCENPSKGNITQTGEAIFVSIDELEALNKEWRKCFDDFKTAGGGVTWACDLYSVCAAHITGKTKQMLDGIFGDGRPVQSKKVTSTWNCCCEDEGGNGCTEGEFTAEIDGKKIR